MDVSPTIEANVRSTFSEHDASAALAVLAGMLEPPQAPEWVVARARVQIATLMLSRGNIESLRAAVKQSQVDWRDTLMSAGLGDANWPSVASSAGFAVPPGCA
jgi:hypothetical protein